jgi:hypothetical protein
MGSATHRMSVDAFDPEITHTMGDAFDWAWDELSDCGHEATLPSKSLATRDLMAKQILSLAEQGVNDRFRLASEAIAVVLVSYSTTAAHERGDKSKSGSSGRIAPKPVSSQPHRIHVDPA